MEDEDAVAVVAEAEAVGIVETGLHYLRSLLTMPSSY
jgi:hypothetical protein